MITIFAWAMLTIVALAVFIILYAWNFDLDLKDLEMTDDDV